MHALGLSQVLFYMQQTKVIWEYCEKSTTMLQLSHSEIWKNHYVLLGIQTEVPVRRFYDFSHLTLDSVVKPKKNWMSPMEITKRQHLGLLSGQKITPKFVRGIQGMIKNDCCESIKFIARNVGECFLSGGKFIKVFGISLPRCKKCSLYNGPWKTRRKF